TEIRCRHLKIDAVLSGQGGKIHALREVCAVMGVTPAECLYVGDDLIDVPPMRVCGLAAVPADGVMRVRAEADWVLERNGGHGVVREAVERLLDEQGRLEETIERAYQLYWCR
ncbi:MAG: HAD hydrolase family protein, partial [Victivallales bacterium]|nr:HAD hydrolase family protein [Victivallales bacterium]